MKYIFYVCILQIPVDCASIKLDAQFLCRESNIEVFFVEPRGIGLHLRSAQIMDTLRQAVARNSPLDWHAICQGCFTRKAQHTDLAGGE